MSASLVGSEMCIRDSSRVSQRLLFGSECPAALQPLLERFGAISRAPRAVSYTHLTLPTICSV
eukprot:9700179-Alexandrium_andersonii.AAC.1